ncbi:MAG: L-threonylcarbamoyladenylate synthase [Conexivisphaerales archaeon]
MQTKIFKVDPIEPDRRVIVRAANLIRSGEVVAFPTETVYGLGADSTNDRAVEKIFTAKGRPSDNPLIVHVSDLRMLSRIVERPGKKELDLISYYWPGPLTIVFRKKEVISDLVTAGLPTVAVRMPSHPVALALIKESGRPIAAPSANLSGRPSPTRAEHVMKDLSGKIPMIIDAGPTEFGVESTVLDLTGEYGVILRPGPITAEDLAPLIGMAKMYRLGKGERPLAPGMKYRHYAPNTKMVLVCGGPNGIVDKINRLAEAEVRKGKRVGVLCTDETKGRYDERLNKVSLGSRFSPYMLVRNLYHSLRTLDDMNLDLIFAEGFPEDGILATLMNRLRKAASKVMEE